MSIDTNTSNTVCYEELVLAFRDVHTNYILHKLKQAITSGKLTAEKVFNASDSDSNKELDVIEFNEMVSNCFQALKKYEVDALFAHFDKQGLGRISVAEFKAGLNERVELESKMKFYLHDFMTPLQTVLRR